MKRSARITIIVFFLTAILFAGAIYFQHSTAHACGSYAISGSNTSIRYAPPGSSDSELIYLSLWYNSCKSSNFGVAKFSGVIGNAYIRTFRFDGAASSAIGCAAEGTCTGSSIYSPTLKAQACVSVGPGAGQIGDTTCTDYF